MEDSARAADLALQAGIDMGLHLNLTEPFTGTVNSPCLSRYHNQVIRFLKSWRYALIFYNPLLRKAFRCVYDSQLEEFRRLYGKEPSHINGHQHMHLSSNMLVDSLIAKGTKVRRSFSFWPGEKSWLNRSYRRCVDHYLIQRYRVTDYFFALSQATGDAALSRISSLAKESNVEVESHPAVPCERAILLSENFARTLAANRLGSYALL